jgi:hypothetical protein
VEETVGKDRALLDAGQEGQEAVVVPVATVVLQQQPEGIACARIGLAAKGEKGGQGARAEIPAPDTAANKENTGAATQTLGPFMERRDSFHSFHATKMCKLKNE